MLPASAHLTQERPDLAPSGRCRICGSPLRHTFVDLGMSPLCESYLAQDQLNQMEPFYPLHVYVCAHCFLVQLEAYVTPEHIFTEYAYFSSYSDSWVDHARAYAATMIARLSLGEASRVVEIGSNDGYLLQHFLARGIPVLGVEPARNVAQVALDRRIPTVIDFFGERMAESLAASGRSADLLIGNNVLAQVPDLNDFVRGLRRLLEPHGVLTLEFPHLLRLMEGNQFDTIYHEHFSYFSLTTAEKLFAAHDLTVVDVQELATHGGSLRLYARHRAAAGPVTDRVRDLRAREEAIGLRRLDAYTAFAGQVEATKRDLLEFLIAARRRGKRVAGYGAPGKGNTLLNHCGIRQDLLDFTVDRNPYKQGKFLPGTHIPIHHPDKLREDRPDYVLILPWNIKDEIIRQIAYIREWHGQFIIPIPRLSVLP